MSSSSIETHTRRDFVKASAVAAMSAPLVAAKAAERPASKAPMRVIETDVLVCGGGCAGTAAALAAARAGAKTRLVDEEP